jgi:MFS family permease
LAQFLGYAHHFVLQPTLPLYVTHLGGSPFVVGLVIASFAVTSVLFRPTIGYWADRWSETGVLMLGLCTLAASVLICFIPFVGATMFANGLRGIGWAGLNTGGYTILATSAPTARRGEASGYYGGVQSSATILFPAVALWIIDAPFGGFYGAFIVSGALALLGLGAGLILLRTIPHVPRSLPDQAAESWLRDLLNVFDRHIVLAATLLFALHLSLPCLTSFVVLFARDNGIDHLGWYFVATGTTSLLARPYLGRVSDKIGCARSLVAAFTLETLALILLPFMSHLAAIMIAGILYYMGFAIGSSRILALAMENAPQERRGRAMASFSVSFPLSNGIGALLSGLAVEMGGYTWMFLSAAALCASGLVLTAKNWSVLK